MPTYSDFYSDGLPKWGAKKNLMSTAVVASSTPEVELNVISGLAGTDIKTNIQKRCNCQQRYDIKQEWSSFILPYPRLISRIIFFNFIFSI